MEIITLGTGSPIPDANRAGPATLVRAAGHDLLVDCGRGVLMRAAAAFSGPTSFSAVLLTHLHSDHVTDLNDIVTMRWAMSPTPNPLRVIGPPGTQQFIDRTLAMLEPDIGWRRAHHADLDWEPACDVTEVTDGVALELDGLRVLAAPTEHRPVQPTVGYRFEADGVAVALSGDTIPCEGLDRLCAGADGYVQTVIRASLVEAIPVQRLQDILDYHSSIQQAAQTAARAGVGTFVMTHMVPPPMPGTEGEWIAEAQEHFDGEVVMADDLSSFTFPAA